MRMDSIHKEIYWQEILEPRKAKLPSIATMEGGESEASKMKLFASRFPLGRTCLCAVNRLDPSPQLCSQVCSTGPAGSVLHTQGRGQRGFHHLNCFCLFLSFLSTPTRTPSAHAASSLPHYSGCMPSNQAPSSLNLFL